LLKEHVFLYATTCSLGQLDEKINHMKISKSCNFETKGCKENVYLKKQSINFEQQFFIHVYVQQNNIV
jgi:hypothetical protein